MNPLGVDFMDEVKTLEESWCNGLLKNFDDANL